MPHPSNFPGPETPVTGPDILARQQALIERIEAAATAEGDAALRAEIAALAADVLALLLTADGREGMAGPAGPAGPLGQGAGATALAALLRATPSAGDSAILRRLQQRFPDLFEA